jgi:AcrR family transcriptional regulator
MARTGRRPGRSGSREKILAAARSSFSRDGYDGATIRDIAASAHVDPALVRHYFGSKEHLFVEALQFPIDPVEFVPRLLAQGRDGLGERLATFFLDTWDGEAGRPFLAMLRSVTASDDAAEMLRQFVAREIIGRIAASLDLEGPELRAGLAGGQLIGLAMLRYVIKLEPIASADRAELAHAIGPSIQHYFDDRRLP